MEEDHGRRARKPSGWLRRSRPPPADTLADRILSRIADVMIAPLGFRLWADGVPIDDTIDPDGPADGARVNDREAEAGRASSRGASGDADRQPMDRSP